MAPDDLKPSETGTAAVEPLPAPAPKRRVAAPRAFEGRFSVAYLALAVIVSGAIIAFAILIKQSPAKHLQWSAWQPRAGGLSAARQIADHVSARYRLPSGSEMTADVVNPFTVSNVPISRFAVRNGTSARDVNVYDGTFPTTTPYTLCGLGKSCSILEGKPSQARGRLIRRQAFELALYTFKYLHGADSVLAYLPPSPGNQLTYVLFLRKIDLHRVLDQPLAATLPGDGPFIVGRKMREPAGLDRFLLLRIFKFTAQQLPDGSAILVLAPRELTS